MTARIREQPAEPFERTALSDEEVVRRVLDGDGPLFEILMRRYNRRLYRVARAILRNDSEAEDVMQQAYVEAYSHLGQFEGRAKFSTWLTKIAVYEALARLRRQRRLVSPAPPPEPEEVAMSTVESTGPSPEQNALESELRALLESVIETLPIRYRSVFVFRDVEGISTAETALCLGVTEEVVKTRLHRARGLLRERLYERTGLATAAAFSFHLSRCDRVVTAVLCRLGLEGAQRTH